VTDIGVYAVNDYWGATKVESDPKDCASKEAQNVERSGVINDNIILRGGCARWLPTELIGMAVID